MANGIGQSFFAGRGAVLQQQGQQTQQQLQQAELERFTDESNLRSMVKGAIELNSITDPAQQDAFLQRRIAEINKRGGDARDTIEMFQTPHAQRRQVAQNVIDLGERFGVIKATKTGKGTGTANIQDFKFYQQLKKTNPEAAVNFARQAGISEKQQKELKPTTAQQNFEIYQAMPEGPAKQQFGTVIGIKPKETPAQAFKRQEKTEEIQTEITGAKQTIGLADQILNTENFLSKITGITGKLPSIPGGVGFDADVVFNQLKNSLTLDNLSKMSGVLSDSDIKILQSAGAGLEFGMSETAMKNRLNTIKKILNNKIKRQEKKISKQSPEQVTQKAPVKDIETRGAELEAQGLSMPEIKAQLKKEGF